MKTLYFVDSIYIPLGTNTAYVRLLSADDEEEMKEVETTTDKLVMKKNKEVLEGEYVYYDDKTGQFTDGSRAKKALDAEAEFFAIQQAIIANGQAIDPHTGLPDYSGLIQ